MNSLEELEEFIFDKPSSFGTGNRKESLVEVSDSVTTVGGTVTTDDLFYIDTGDDIGNTTAAAANNDDEENGSGANAVHVVAAGEKAAWIDNDQDTLGSINIQKNNRSKKLKRSFDEAVIDANDYEERLRAQFRKIHHTPEWATLDSSSDTATAVNSYDDQDLLITSKPLVQKELTLNPDKLVVVRAKDANHAEYAKVLFCYSRAIYLALLLSLI